MTANVISEASICNQALARIGSTQSITSLDPATDESNESAQCRIWYPSDRDAMLCDFPWPWSESYVQLAQIAGPEINGQVANAQWSRSYRYPSDCLKLRRIVRTPAPSSGTVPPQTTGIADVITDGNQPWKRAVGQPYPISYALSQDSIGRLIVTDDQGYGSGLTAVYTRAVADPTQFSADFADALAWRLAVDLAMGLGYSDGKRQAAEQHYEMVIRKARAAAMNELQSDMPLVDYRSASVRARWGG